MSDAPLHARRSGESAVPLLLSSFPAPPSHIPVSPAPSPAAPPHASPPHASPPHASPPHVNPPLSLPPAAPLPPVPGPSPVSERQALSFISATRSRRTSKLSVASTASVYSTGRRDSTATLSSSASSSIGPATPAPARSLRSYSSNGSLRVPPARWHDVSPVLHPRICEEDPAELTRLSLDDLVLTHEPEPMSDEDEDAGPMFDLSDFPMPASARAASPLPNPYATSSTTPRAREPRLPNPHPPDTNKALPPLPLSRAPSFLAHPPAHAYRTASPDIPDIIARTPRPRRKSSSSNLRTRSASRAALRRHGSSASTAPSTFRKSTGSASFGRRSRGSVASGRAESPSRLAYLRDEAAGEWDEEEDYGELLNAEDEDRLERELEGAGSGSDTDSSIDIHTPLPNLMLRDGMLSPNSKLLPQASTPAPSSRGSIFSIASAAGSIMTKSGIYKDGRDTLQRRIRHRDGKTLKGGIGLTTGLGWSDSEDEDAPSPLTRQLSSGTLSKRKSSAARPSPLSRSVSAPIKDVSAAYDAISEPLPVHASHASLSSLPPMPSLGLHALRTSHASVSSAGSASSAGLPARASAPTLRAVPSSSRLRVPASSSLGALPEDGGDSSSSNASSPMPLTPSGSEDGLAHALAAAAAARPDSAAGPSRMALPRKSLGELPRARTGSGPPSSFHAKPGAKAVPRPLQLPRSHSSPSSTASTPNPSASTIKPSGEHSSLGPRTTSSGSTGSRRSSERVRTISGGLRPPASASRSSALSYSPSELVAQPQSARLPPSSRLSPLPSSNSAPTTPLSAQQERPKPRTGTGMVYRTSTRKESRPTLMRMPSSKTLNAL